MRQKKMDYTKNRFAIGEKVDLQHYNLLPSVGKRIAEVVEVHKYFVRCKIKFDNGSEYYESINIRTDVNNCCQKRN